MKTFTAYKPSLGGPIVVARTAILAGGSVMVDGILGKPHLVGLARSTLNLYRT